MSRLPRPYIPLAVRVQVAERQIRKRGAWTRSTDGDGAYLAIMIESLFGDEKCHLDHDPPLGARKKIRRGGVIVGYRPAANDPTCLIYRTKVGHQLKTNVRGEHGQYPDRVLIKKVRRLEQQRQVNRRFTFAVNKSKPKRKPKMASNLTRNGKRGGSLGASRCTLRSANRWPPKGSRKFGNKR